MEFSILQDNKNLFAKCKLLGDYKPITTLVSGTRVRFSIGSILPSVDGDVGADMVFYLSNNLDLLQVRLKCIDSDGDYYPAIKSDFGRNNLTLEAQSQGYQILLSKSNRLVVLVKDGKIVYVFASRGMIVKVLADDEYLYMKTISKLYSYNLSTLELCEVANLWN